jgi:hypothetical protein
VNFSQQLNNIWSNHRTLAIVVVLGAVVFLFLWFTPKGKSTRNQWREFRDFKQGLDTLEENVRDAEETVEVSREELEQLIEAVNKRETVREVIINQTRENEREEIDAFVSGTIDQRTRDFADRIGGPDTVRVRDSTASVRTTDGSMVNIRPTSQ